jgi:hypothetical protein
MLPNPVIMRTLSPQNPYYYTKCFQQYPYLIHDHTQTIKL